MEITLHIPDDVAKRLSAAGGDVSRCALEALAVEGYREQTLTLYQISEMLACPESKRKTSWDDVTSLYPRLAKRTWIAKRQYSKRDRAVRVSTFTT